MRPTGSRGGRLDDDPDLVTGLCGVAIDALARRERALAAAVVARLRALSTSSCPTACSSMTRTGSRSRSTRCPQR